jgi:aldose 1-epimerase
MVELRRDDQRAVVDEEGATLHAWSWQGRQLLAGGGPPADFRGRVLAPWPNRLRDGRYVFAGTEHHTPITEPARHVALHGLVSALPWRVAARADERVTLALALEPRPGYPFRLDLEVVYALEDDGLVVTLAATNAGDGPAPFGAGFHPYLDCGRADDVTLEVPAGELVPLDGERLLPTGPPVAVEGHPEDLRRPRELGGLALNACYTALTRDDDGIARVRVSGAEIGFTVWMDAAFGFAQLYSADDVGDPAQRRRSIAVEPMTCAPDALNTGVGLVVLEPGSRLTGRWGIRPIA